MSKYKLLLIDDDQVEVLTFQRSLRKSEIPHQLNICYNADEALKAIENTSFDCIFLDYLLPGIDGLQLLRKLRAKPINTPVAVMASQGDEKIAVEMLDFSKIEAGKVTFENIDFDLRQRMAELRKTFDHRTKEKGIEFEIEIDSKIPPVIKGNPFRLNQILFNLVGNAIKFTSEGFIKVVANLIKEKENKLTLQFSVQDTGIGIPFNAQERIFESLTQVNTDTSRKYGGTGLGLAITKNLVQLQGGKLSLISTVGEGTTFFATINYQIGNALNLNENKKKEEEPTDQSNLNILLVEDNQMNQFVAKQFFKKWKNKLTIANHSAEAISILIERNDIDIVVMDLQMPEMNGFQAAEIISGYNSAVTNTNIPISALSADAFLETRRKVIEAGLNDYVTKPFNPEELYGKIIKYTNKAILPLEI